MPSIVAPWLFSHTSWMEIQTHGHTEMALIRHAGKRHTHERECAHRRTGANTHTRREVSNFTLPANFFRLTQYDGLTQIAADNVKVHALLEESVLT